MTLIPYDKSKIEYLEGYSKTKNQKILEEFINSDMDCAEVVEYTNKDAHSVTNSLNLAIKRFRYANIRAISRKDRAFLIKTT